MGLGSYHFLPGGGAVCLWGGGQNFLGWSEGGAKIFSRGQKGGPIFFQGVKGGGPGFFSKRGANFFCAFGAIHYLL